MIKGNVTLTPEDANGIIRELERLEADMLAILAQRNKITKQGLTPDNCDHVLHSVKHGAETAAKLARQFAGIRVAQSVAQAQANPPKPRPKRSYTKPTRKAAPAAVTPMDFSGSFLSMLLRAS